MTTMKVANEEEEGNNTTTNSESLLYSTFSLRPPLPSGNNNGVISASASASASASDGNNNNNKNDDDKLPTRHKRQKIISKKQHEQQLNYCVVINSSFIFRMYVACHILRVKTETRFTAIVLLHRYAQSKNKNINNRGGNNNNNNKNKEGDKNDNDNDEDNDDDWPWIGAVCLFLACKTEEEPRRLRDVINMARMVLSSSSTSKDNSDNGNNKNKSILNMNLLKPPSLNEEAYWDSKRKAIETESIVLRWLGFDCSVSHPHRAVYWILGKEIEVWQQLLLLSNSAKSIQTQTTKEITTLDDKNLPIPRKPNYDNAAAAAADAAANDSNDDNFNNNSDNNNSGSTITIQRDKLLSLAFRRLNDALFYPIALQWGIVEMACAALDLAVHRLEEEGKNDDDDTNNDTTTSLIHNNKNSGDDDDNSQNNSSISNESFFKKEWWKRYGVSNEIFDGCKKSLKEATSYLENVSTTTTTASTVSTQVREYM
jgi:hypothetical protein